MQFGEDVVAMLTPAQLDPFSTDPASALIKFGADRNLKVLASSLIRPQEVVTGSQRRVWWLVAGLSVLAADALWWILRSHGS